MVNQSLLSAAAQTGYSNSTETLEQRVGFDTVLIDETTLADSLPPIIRRSIDSVPREGRKNKTKPGVKKRTNCSPLDERESANEERLIQADADEQQLSTRNMADFTDYNPNTFPMRHVNWELEDSHIIFNPATTLIAVASLWGIAIWCLLTPESSNMMLLELRQSVTQYCTWLFIMTKAVTFFFVVFLVWKFGHIRLGNEEPEFSNISYSCLIFIVGISMSPIVYAVSEPMWHQQDNFFTNQGYHTQDEIDMFAINLTVADWALSGWAPYAVVAIAMGLAGYRFNMPMTFRSCFYPILGEYTWGWIGDVLDGFAIVVIVFSICTNLGIGAVQIVVAFEYFGWIVSNLLPSQVIRFENATIWAVTIIAIALLMTGLRRGVQKLSFLAFLSFALLLFLVFWMENTKFLLNLMVQEVGYYCQYSIFQLTFWTDAFAQLHPGEGRSIDEKSSAIWWMDIWMVFYEAWWVTASAYAGMFIARISRGRTITEVALYSVLVPTLFCGVWFCTWGGIGLRQSRQAKELEVLGSAYFGDNATFRVNGSNICYDVPQENIYVNNTLVFANYLPGVTPVCLFDPAKANEAILNVLYSFSYPADFDTGFGPILGVLLVLAIALSFSTSSDAASFIVDFLASNGIVNHHWTQLLFWPITQAMLATALITVGGTKALEAVQAVAILAGLPFALLLWFLMHTSYLFCVKAMNDSETSIFTPDSSPEFSVPAYAGIFNIMEYMFSLGRVHKRRLEKNMDLPSRIQVVEFVKGLLIPFVSLHQILKAAYPRNITRNALVVTTSSILHVCWIAVFVASIHRVGLRSWGWAIYFGFGTILSSIRNGFRRHFNIRSHVPADLLLSCFLWPQVLAQMRIHLIEVKLVTEGNDDDNKLTCLKFDQRQKQSLASSTM